MFTFCLLRQAAISDSEPILSAMLTTMTQLSCAVRPAARRSSAARAGSLTIRRRMPNSAVSEMQNARISIPAFCKTEVISLIFPILFSMKTETCCVYINHFPHAIIISFISSAALSMSDFAAYSRFCPLQPTGMQTAAQTAPLPAVVMFSIYRLSSQTAV